MSRHARLAAVEEEAASLVVLTVYARHDIAVCTRVLQALTLSRVVTERFVADLSQVDLRRVKGLEHESAPVMRVVLVVSVPEPQDLERLTKVFNRMVDVVKVVHSHRF